MDVRELPESDLAACAAIFVTVFAAEPWNEQWEPRAVELRLREIQQTPGFLGLGAYEDDALIAFVLGYAEQWGEVRHFYVKEMCVQTRWHRHGVGSALMEALSDRLKRQGVAKLYLLTARDGPAESFYASCGFYTSTRMVMMGKYLTEEKG